MALKIHGTDNIQAGTVQTQVLAGGVGGGPKITGIAVTDSSYTNIDDTAVGLSGGYIKITGTGFVSGCSIIIGATVATSVSFINSTEVRAQVPAQSAGTYTVYLVNSDGGVGIRVNGLNYSSTPTWTTTSPLGDGAIDTAISVQLAATSNSAVTYALQAGSTLPAGLSLSSGGLLSGTVTGITVDTTYNFTVVATDQESQDTPQAFSITISVNDPYFKNTVLLLQADTAPTIISDASANNFDLTVSGDARASNFTPYGTGWSVYFDGTGDSLSISDNPVLDLGNSEFCIELWHYPTVFAAGWLFSKQTNYLSATGYLLRTQTTTGYIEFSAGSSGASWDIANIVTSQVPTLNAWNHIAVTRSSTDNRIRVFLNGALAGLTGVTTASIQDTSAQFTIGNDSGGSVGCTGYISNFRLVKGSIPAAYQTASTTVGISQIFVPPTQPLTAVANTSLLTCQSNRFLDSSSNGFAITRNGDARVVSFNPFGITNTGVNGSAYFDGTGDYLDQLTATTAFNLSSGDWTIEAWIYRNVSGAFHMILNLWNTAGSNSGLTFYVNASNQLVTDNGITPALAAGFVSAGQWVHLAIVRSGGTTTGYINGTSVGTTTQAPNAAQYARIGVIESGSYLFNGYIANLRIVKNTAVYTANFTPPTQPLTAIANTQLLTLQYDQPHNNHTFLDSSSNQFAITRNGNTTQGTFSPFSQSGHSVYFDGTGDYLSLADNEAWTLGSSDFSLEAWIYPTVIPADQYPGVIGHRTSYTVSLGWGISINLASTLAFAYSTSGDGSATQSGIFVPITATELLAKWSHIVVTRSGSQFRMFINGQLRGTLTSSGTIFNSTSPVVIGRLENQDGNYFTGYISNVRLVKGSIPAEYQTSSTTVSAQIFTPPIQTVTAISGTQLLACHANRFIDGSTNNFTVTRNGDVRITSFGPFSTTVYSATSNGGSAYFDGTGDYLTVPHDPAVVLNNEDWTIEFWVYPTVDARADVICKGNGGSYVPYMIILLPSGQINFNASNSGSGHAILLYSNTGDYRLFQWNHIAVTKSGSTIRIFCQGALVATGTYSGGAMTNSLPLGIGAGSDGVQRLTGYMSNVRIIKGTALYTSAFTVPTAPPSPTTNTSLLLNCTDAAMRDSRGLAVLETVGDAKVSTVRVKYGTGSMRFDGTGDRLTVPATPNLTLSTGDFTIEMWINSGTNGGSTRVMGNGAGAVWSANKWVIGATSNFFIAVNNYSNSTSMMTSTTAAGDNTWHHFAVTRSGNVWRLFVDGVQQSTVTSSVSLDGGVAANIDIGRGGISSDADWAGYLDDLRITRGQARYTANFTPPAAKFLAR